MRPAASCEAGIRSFRALAIWSSTSTSRRVSARTPICCRRSAASSTTPASSRRGSSSRSPRASSWRTRRRSGTSSASCAALGVQLGLDDFGMGYSALSYLQHFPFQTIKIDRSFVSGMENGSNTEIIRAIVAMAAGLAMDVTAEGIETADQVNRLQELSCEFGQGYYFDKPLTRESRPGDSPAGHQARTASHAGGRRACRALTSPGAR